MISRIEIVLRFTERERVWSSYMPQVDYVYLRVWSSWIT